MFPPLALIEMFQKRLDLIKTVFPLPLKETGSAPDIYMEVTLSVHAQFTLPVHFGKIKQSDMELVFHFLLLLFFCFSLLLYLLVLFNFAFVKHKEKTSKM